MGSGSFADHDLTKPRRPVTHKDKQKRRNQKASRPSVVCQSKSAFCSTKAVEPVGLESLSKQLTPPTPDTTSQSFPSLQPKAARSAPAYQMPEVREADAYVRRVTKGKRHLFS